MGNILLKNKGIKDRLGQVRNKIWRPIDPPKPVLYSIATRKENKGLSHNTLGSPVFSTNFATQTATHRGDRGLLTDPATAHIKKP